MGTNTLPLVELCRLVLDKSPLLLSCLLDQFPLSWLWLGDFIEAIQDYLGFKIGTRTPMSQVLRDGGHIYHVYHQFAGQILQ